MLRRAIVLLLFIPQLTFSQSNDQPFQVLVAENAFVFGKAVEPLQFIDDVTSIEIKPEGFLALVHKGGTTYELKEKTFTFYLKPEKLKELESRPELSVLYQDSSKADGTKEITVLYPQFDNSRIVKWEANTPFEMYWHLPDEPVITYKVSVFNHDGNKIQDFGTRKNKFVLKPYNFGLQETSFIFKVTSTFAGETISSPEYRIELETAPNYPIKASDLVLKSLNLELSPINALEVWKEVLGMENGKQYFFLFEKFIARNKTLLTTSGEDVELLLSQNR